MLSIIIPTLNEEKYLPLLLESIKKQSFADYEIIVADAGSKDRTVEIAKNYGCRIVRGGLPAKGRNEGARVAKGEALLFSDADTLFPKDFLEQALDESSARNLGVAAFGKIPVTNKASLKLFTLFYNLVEKIVPFGGMVILARKNIHEKLGGFNENIKLGEDTDYLWRAKRRHVFGIIKSTKFFLSLRRFEAQGYFKTIFTYLAAGLYMIIFGFPKSNIFKYRFDIYHEKRHKMFKTPF